MTHPLKHRKTLSSSLIGAAVVALGLMAPIAASADSNDRVRLSIKATATPVSHNYREHKQRKYHRKSHRRDHRYDNRYDRVSHRGYDSRYFVRPYTPLNFKHWLRVERRVQAYTPNMRHLNRYELRQVLGHSYDRYLRDHRRWSKRASARSHRNDNRRDRWIASSDRKREHNRNRRW